MRTAQKGNTKMYANTFGSLTTPSNTANPNVVLNDILNSGIPVTVSSVDQAPNAAPSANPSTATAPDAVQWLETLIDQRRLWEENAYRTSNEQLYVILQRIYDLYVSVSRSENKLRQEQMLNYCSAKGYRFTKSTHLITKVVRCVFEDKAMDRRRVSAYSLVLRAAHKEVIDGRLKADAIAEFVRTQGGVEQVRLAKGPSALTAKQKAQAAAQKSAETIATVRSETLSRVLAVNNVNKHAVLLTVQQPDGSFAVKSLIYSDGAVNAALAAFYKNLQDMQANEDAVAAVTDSDQRKADAVAAAVQDASCALAA
jgi:hypothetical protein